MSHFPSKAGDAFNLMSEQTHLEATLQRDIDTIRSKVERMAGLAESALSDSVILCLMPNNSCNVLSVVGCLHDNAPSKYH